MTTLTSVRYIVSFVPSKATNISFHCGSTGNLIMAPEERPCFDIILGTLNSTMLLQCLLTLYVDVNFTENCRQPVAVSPF